MYKILNSDALIVSRHRTLVKAARVVLARNTDSEPCFVTAPDYEIIFLVYCGTLWSPAHLEGVQEDV